MSTEPQKASTTFAFVLSLVVTASIGAAIIFGIKYFETKRERDALLFKQALKQHDEQLMNDQRDYMVKEMATHTLERTRARRAKNEDVPEAVLEAEDRNTVYGLSSGPGLPPDTLQR